MGKPRNHGFWRIIKATGYSWQGLRAAFRHEAAFRQELILVLVLVPVAFLFRVSAAERAIMVFSVMLVPIVELLNSALEAIVDRIGPEHHELSGRAKDVGSAAVLVCLAAAVLVWGIVLFS